MRRVVVSMFLTLDGVMEDPGGAEGSKHGGWQRPYFDEGGMGYMVEQQAETGGLLLGRITYQGFAAAWPSMTDMGEFGDRMNSMPKYVASRTLTEMEWNASLIKGDVPEEVAKLKQQPGKDLYVLGSGQLIDTLRHHNLIDEYQLWVHPLILGGGKRLFKDGSDMTSLKLVDSKTTGSGIVILTYRPADSPPADSK